MESIRMVIDWVNNLLWGKNILVVMLIGTALYFTVRTKDVYKRQVGNCEGLDYNGQYNLIDPDYVFDKIEEMSKKFIIK